MKNLNYKLEAIIALKEIAKKYPNQLFSTHLSIALADYANFDGISDKELYFIFSKYLCAKELDMGFAVTDDIDSIIKDGMNLSLTNLEDDEEDF